eukprot:2692215-Prymnesium_polylepis.1
MDDSSAKLHAYWTYLRLPRVGDLAGRAVVRGSGRSPSGGLGDCSATAAGAWPFIEFPGTDR